VKISRKIKAEKKIKKVLDKENGADIIKGSKEKREFFEN
jgi:hypothetical protein